MTQFHQIDPANKILGATFGEGNSQVIVFKHKSAQNWDVWEQVPGTRILVIGGAPARRELKRLIDARKDGISREELQRRGIQVAGRTHHRLREWLGLA